MPKPCRADGHGDAPVPGCRLCELAATRADYAALWGEPIPPVVRSAQDRRKIGASPPPCPALGAPTGLTVGCRSCSGLVDMPLYSCSRHGLTVLGNRAPASDDVKACRWCPDRPR